MNNLFTYKSNSKSKNHLEIFSDKESHNKYIQIYEKALKGIKKNEVFDIFEIGVLIARA